MDRNKTIAGALGAAAIGSAAIAAGLLYSNKRKEKDKAEAKAKAKKANGPHTPTGEKPETD